jgi:predicted DCC family thiol-disulfide oxidoreductase YuxK
MGEWTHMRPCRQPLVLAAPIERAEAPTVRLESTIIFDGTCGFCTWSIAALGKPSHVAHVVPYQWLTDAQLETVGTTRAHCIHEVHYVDAGGRVYRGANAVNEALAHAPLIGGILGYVGRHRALLGFERACYAWVAAHRVAISRVLGTRRCALIAE